MKKFLLWSFGLVAAGTILYGVYLYLTEFYYMRPNYTLAVKTDLDGDYRNVTLRLFPQGEFNFGILGRGGNATHMDPPWPLPDKFVLKFDDPEGRHHELDLPSNLQKGFKGRITVVIKKNDQGYFAEIETAPLNR